MIRFAAVAYENERMHLEDIHLKSEYEYSHFDTTEHVQKKYVYSFRHKMHAIAFLNETIENLESCFDSYIESTKLNEFL